MVYAFKKNLLIVVVYIIITTTIKFLQNATTNICITTSEKLGGIERLL
jgi:hypothetical protein